MSVSVIDGAANTILSTISVGTSPTGVGVNASTNRIYVTNTNSNTVSVIDGAANTILSTISVGSLPYGVGVNSSTNRIYVSNFAGNTISVIDDSPSSPPTVTTSSATNVTSNSATLNGTVNANGASTTAWFQYGTTSGSYSSTSATQTVSGSSDTSISISASGLSSSTTYYYRIAAQNSVGTSYGSESTFTTLAPPNTAPVANAGADQTAYVGNVVTLDGSGSYDVDGNLLTYSWAFTTVPQGSNAVLSDAAAVTPSFTVDKAGTYVVSLIVNDGTVDSAADTVTISTQSCVEPPAGLVSWWPGDGNADDIQNGNDGTLQGGVTFAPGMVGQAFSFDGVDDFVKIPASANLDVGLGSGFTLDAWINPADASTYRPLFEWNNGAGQFGPGAVFWIAPGAALYANLVDTAGAYHAGFTPGGIVQAGVWQHVALTYEKQTGIAKIYLNWNLVATLAVGTFTPQTSYDLYLGHRPPIGVPHEHRYVGLMDEAEVFNRALSAQEIQAIYNAGSAGKCKGAALNSAPVANAGQDQTPYVGNTVTLDGSGSYDVDGNLLTFKWVFTSVPTESTATLSDSTSVNPTFTIDKAGAYVVSLTVNDGTVDSAADTVTISTLNSAPVADAGTDQTPYVNDTVTLNGSNSYDVDGNLLTYSWAFTTVPQGSAASLVNPTSVNPTFTVDKAGTYVVSLMVNDGTVNSAADTVTISTLNSAPVANAGADQSVYVGDTATLDGSGSSDVDGNLLTYSWAFTSKPSGSTATLNNAAAVSPSFAVDKAGTYVVSLIVNDGTVNSAPDTITISTINVAPVANAGNDQTVPEESTVTLDGSGSSDADGDTLTYSWAFTTKPAESTATLSGTTTENPTFTVDEEGTYVVSLIVNDGTVNSAPDTVTITAEESEVEDVEAEVEIKPETINLKSKGKFKAFIELPEPYSADEVVLATVVCEGAHAIDGRVDGEDRYIATFNTQDLRITVSSKEEEVTITVSGELEDGTRFTGSDTVKVKGKEKEKEKDK